MGAKRSLVDMNFFLIGSKAHSLWLGPVSCFWTFNWVRRQDEVLHFSCQIFQVQKMHGPVDRSKNKGPGPQDDRLINITYEVAMVLAHCHPVHSLVIHRSCHLCCLNRACLRQLDCEMILPSGSRQIHTCQPTFKVGRGTCRSDGAR